MKELIVKKDENGEYVEYKGVILKYEHKSEEGYGEYDFFDMNPEALHGPTIVVHTFKIGEFETSYTHDIHGPSSYAPFPKFYAHDCVDGKGFEIIRKYPGTDLEEKLGLVKFASGID